MRNFLILYIFINIFNKLYGIDVVSPLVNQTYLLTAASHGLTFVVHSKTYIFSGTWTQLIEVKYPSNLFDNDNFIIPFTPINCTLTPNTEALDKLCSTYNSMLKILIETNQGYRELLTDSLRHIIKDLPVNSWLRSKRSVIPLVGDALSILFGTAKSDEVRDLKNNYNFMLNEIKNNKDKTILLTKQLIGLTQLEKERAEKINVAIRDIGKHLEIIDELFNEHWLELRRLRVANSFSRDLETRMNEAIINIINSIYNLNLLNNQIYDIKESMNQLRKGNLPVNLVPWSRLNPILLKIEKEIKPLYELAIPETNWQLYYNLPLTKFSLMKNGVLIKLVIPIKTRNTQIKYNLLMPKSYPIPCDSDFCTWFDRIRSNETFMTLDLKNHLWLSDSEFNKLYGEINLASLNCIFIGNEKLCYVFDRSSIIPLSACTNELWAWRSENIIKYCKFEISLQESYFTIKVKSDLFIIHKNVISNYDLICVSQGSKSKEVKNWAEDVILNEGCYMQTDKFKIYGPLRYREKSLDSVKTETPNFIFKSVNFSNEQIKSQSENDKHKFVPGRKFETNKFDNILQLDLKAMTSALNELWLSFADVGNEINHLYEIRANDNNSSVFNVFLDIISQTLIISIFYMLILNLIIRGYKLFYITPFFVLTNDALASTFEAPVKSKNPITTIVEEPFVPIIQVISLITGIIIWLFIVKSNYFRKISCKRFKGKFNLRNDENVNTYFYINFVFNSRKLLTSEMNEVQIRVPCLCVNELTQFISLSSSIKPWIFVENNGCLYFKFISKIEIIVDMNNDVEDVWSQNLNISLDEVKWMGRKPDFENAVQYSGIASVSLVRYVNYI